MSKKDSRKPAERRKAQRLEVSLELLCRKKGEKKAFEAVSKDISGMGIGLFTQQPLPKGTKVGILIVTSREFAPGEEIKLSFAGDKKAGSSFPATGKVVWSKQINEGKYHAGLVFEKIENWNKFVEFICEKLINSSVT
jgi:hypothetical protein